MADDQQYIPKHPDQAAADSAHRFDAFISYSRVDRHFAAALERALERYQPPASLGLGKQRLEVFRDEGDMTGTDYYRAIESHLLSSRKLIVICSPDARRSEFVDDEIARFAKGRSVDDIIPILLRGIPNNVATESQHADMAFPRALSEAVELPLSIDYSAFGPETKSPNDTAFESAWFMLLANLYGVDRAVIEQRERRRQSKRRRLIGAAALAIITSLSVLSAVALWQRNIAQSNEQEANEQRSIALEQRNEALRSQSLFLAKQSRDQTTKGRPGLGAKLALSGLPTQIDERTRPFVRSAEMALFTAMMGQEYTSILSPGETDNEDLSAIEVRPGADRVVTEHRGIGGHIRIWDAFSAELLATHQAQRYYVVSTDVSPDGRYLAVGFAHLLQTITYDGMPIPNEVRIYDLENGQLLDRLGIEGYSDLFVKFGPNERTLFIASEQRALVMEILAEPGARRSGIFKTKNAHGRIRLTHYLGANAVDASFSQDGDTLGVATSGGDGVLFDVSGQYSYRLIGIGDKNLMSIEVSPDGVYALGVTADHGVHVIEVLSGTILGALPPADPGHYVSATFSDDGAKIRAISSAGILSAWSVPDIEQLSKETLPVSADVASAFFAMPADRLVLGLDDGSVKFHMLGSDETMAIGSARDGKLIDVDFDTQTGQVAIARDDNTARLWQRLARPVSQQVSDPGKKAKAAALSNNGAFLAIGYEDGSTEIRVADSLALVRRLPGAEGSVEHVSFNSEATELVVGYEDGHANVWPVASGAMRLTFSGHRKGVAYTAFSDDGEEIITTSSDATTRVWNAHTGELRHQLTVPDRYLDPIFNASILPWAGFTRDGRHIVTSNAGDGYVITQPALVWSRGTGELEHALTHTGAIWSTQITPDDTSILTTSYDHTAVIWDISTGERKMTFTGHESTITNARIHPQSGILVTASGDATVRTWSLDSGAVIDVLRGHETGVLSLAIDEEARFIASGDVDGGVRLWDARGGEMIKAWKDHTEAVLQITFEPRGRGIYTLSKDGTVRRYTLLPLGQSLIDLARERFRSQGNELLTREQRIRFSLEER
jgi:WD40 repeat protein